MITLLLTFTITWFPWIALMCQDMYRHASGEWEEILERKGCLEDLPMEYSVT